MDADPIRMESDTFLDGLISELKELRDKEGNLPVYVYAEGSAWGHTTIFKITVEDEGREGNILLPRRIVIW